MAKSDADILKSVEKLDSTVKALKVVNKDIISGAYRIKVSDFITYGHSELK